MRKMKLETTQALAQAFGNLAAAVTDKKSANDSITALVKSGETDPAKFHILTSSILRCQKIAVENALYLGTRLGNFVAEIAETRPEVMVAVFQAIGNDLPEVVNAINEQKIAQKQKNEEKRAEEIRQAVEDALNATK